MGQSESSIKSDLQSKPLTVIIGGGSGGITAAKELDKHCNVLLIEKKNFFFLNVGAPRALIDKSFTKKLVIPMDKVLKYGKVLLNTTVLSISFNKDKDKDNDNIITFKYTPNNKEYKIKYNYLILATGSAYSFPFKVIYSDYNDTINKINNVSDILSNVDNILIIGGGSTGCETVGELCEKYSNKQIVLVNSKNRLLDTVGHDAFSKEIYKRLSETYKNLRIILGDKVVFNDDIKMEDGYALIKNERKLIKTQKGEEIKDIDIVLMATGPKVNLDLYKNTLIENIIDKTGRIKVKKTLQIDFSEEKTDINFNNIFAIGDAANHSPKMVYYAGETGKIAAKNIIKLINNDNNLIKLEPPKALLLQIVPLGLNQGASLFPFGSNGTIKGSNITRFVKGKEFFAPKYWNELGYRINDGMPKNYPKKLTGPDFDEKFSRFKNKFIDANDSDLKELFE